MNEEKKVCCDTNENDSCCQELKNTSCVKCEKLPYVIIIILLIIIAILAFFVGKNYNTIFKGNGLINTVKTDNSNLEKSNLASDIEIKVIGDKRCSDCQTPLIIDSLKKLPFLTGATFKEMDFSDEGVKDLIKANDIKALPAFLFNSNNISEPQFVNYLQKTPSGLYNLAVGSTFDPFAEICDNGVDDNDDGLADCQDTKCSKNIACSPKVNKPVADLYIMSYCPYGLQAQKGYLEVMSKLGKVADINIKFVQYAMHGEKEITENVIQYCIEKEQKDKYIDYLNCYLAEEGKGEACRKQVKINEKKLSSCIDKTNKEFDIKGAFKRADEKRKKYKAEGKVEGQDVPYVFEEFDINKDEAIKAGVEGSPTFVLNGIKIDKIGRNAKAFADVICSSFKTKPKECDENFQDITFDPMFGFTTGNGASSANSGCGQ
ncbi:MAG: hypothetical protein PHE25_03275 [Candidatus Gracilibacteria bacterium]|nr:hypothetical protein [Candidatus Gracilibacteria bacterium]